MKIGRRVIPNSLALFIVLALGAGLYLGLRSEKPSAEPDGEPTVESAKDQAAEEGGASAQTSGSGSQTATKPDTPTSSSPQSSKTVTISSLRQSGSAVVVSAIITGATSGTCTATYEKAGATSVTGTGPVELVTSYYACQVSIPVSSFSPMGEWTARVKLGEVTSEPKTVTIQ
jgi:hypothetical protein